tara:strand:- start:869 stop:1267 length:399 start_codon:yes stop_codon:yes gene_type:complete
MDKLADITKDVPPTSFTDLKPTPVNINTIINQIISTLSSEQSEMFKLGEVKRGKRSLSSLDIIKEALYKEIEALNLTVKAEDDKIERLVDSKTRKMLQQQVDNIISTLEMSVNKQDSRHYILGLILRLLIED